METLDNPLGYEIAPCYMDENADWDKLYAGCNEEQRREVVALNKRFIKQVIESGGYDVDCVPDFTFMSPFIPLEDFKSIKVLYPKIKKAGEFVLWKLNNAIMPHTRIRYKLVDVEKVVNEHTWRYLLLTLTAKEVDASDYDSGSDDEERFKEGCLDLWGIDRVKRGEKFKEIDDAEIENNCNANTADGDGDGDGPIVTIRATVDIYPDPAEGKGYQVTDLRVKRGSKGYQLFNDLILDLACEF